MEESNQYCTFTVDGLFCGVDVVRVQEVLRYQDMTCVPLAPSVVTGLINLRGQIVTAIDMRKRMGLSERDPEQLPMNVIVHSADGAALSLLVDEIGDVLELDEADAEAPPVTLRGVASQLITKTYKLDGKLLLVLDTEKAIDIHSNSEAA